MEEIFDTLKTKIAEMADSSEANKNSVSAITDTINIYRENIDMVIGDNKIINEVSMSMLELAHTGKEE